MKGWWKRLLRYVPRETSGLLSLAALSGVVALIDALKPWPMKVQL